MDMRTLLFCSVIAIFPAMSRAQETTNALAKDSLLTCESYRLWIDGGLYPLHAPHSGGFQPTFNIRFGVGRTFSIADFYAFLEYTKRSFVPPDELSSTTSSREGYDLAAYAAGTVLGVFFLGGGIYFTHQDNIVTRYWYSNTTHESGIRSHVGVYYLAGLQHQFRISDRLIVPIGVYYRDQEAPTDVLLEYQLSFRVGVIYLHR